MKRLVLLFALAASCASAPPPRPTGHQAGEALMLCVPTCALIGRSVAGMVIDATKHTYDCACVLMPGELPTRVPKPEAM